MSMSDVYDNLQAFLSGIPVGYSHRGGGRHPIEIAVQLSRSGLAMSARTLSTPVPAMRFPCGMACDSCLAAWLDLKSEPLCH